MNFIDGLVIGAAVAIAATFLTGLLTELLAIAILCGFVIGRRKWRNRSTPSTTRKSPSESL